MDSEYQEVKIIAVEKEKIKLSPDKKDYWIVPFKLSHEPDSAWERNFYEYQEKNNDAMKRKSVLNGGFFEVEVLEDDDLQTVLNDLKNQIAATNAQCSEDHQQKLKIRQELEELRERESNAKKKFKDDADKLIF